MDHIFIDNVLAINTKIYINRCTIHKGRLSAHMNKVPENGDRKYRNPNGEYL